MEYHTDRWLDKPTNIYKWSNLVQRFKDKEVTLVPSDDDLEFFRDAFENEQDVDATVLEFQGKYLLCRVILAKEKKEPVKSKRRKKKYYHVQIYFFSLFLLKKKQNMEYVI